MVTSGLIAAQRADRIMKRVVKASRVSAMADLRFDVNVSEPHSHDALACRFWERAWSELAKVCIIEGVVS